MYEQKENRKSELYKRLAGNKADAWFLRQNPKVINLSFKQGIKRADRDNAIDVKK